MHTFVSILGTRNGTMGSIWTPDPLVMIGLQLFIMCMYGMYSFGYSGLYIVWTTGFTSSSVILVHIPPAQMCDCIIVCTDND